jgi:hypothetical protein
MRDWLPREATARGPCGPPSCPRPRRSSRHDSTPSRASTSSTARFTSGNVGRGFRCRSISLYLKRAAHGIRLSQLRLWDAHAPRRMQHRSAARTAATAALAAAVQLHRGVTRRLCGNCRLLRSVAIARTSTKRGPQLLHLCGRGGERCGVGLRNWSDDCANLSISCACCRRSAARQVAAVG